MKQPSHLPSIHTMAIIGALSVASLMCLAFDYPLAAGILFGILFCYLVGSLGED